MTYRDYSTHARGSYGKTFTVTATDLTTGETATGAVRIRPLANLTLWGPYANPGKIYLSVDNKAGPSIADDTRVRISITGHLVTELPANCSGPLTAVVCDLGALERDRPLVGISLPALPGTTGFITATAVLSSAWPDPDSSNNSGTAGPYDPMGGPGPDPNGSPEVTTAPGTGGGGGTARSGGGTTPTAQPDPAVPDSAPSPTTASPAPDLSMPAAEPSATRYATRAAVPRHHQHATVIAAGVTTIALLIVAALWWRRRRRAPAS